MPGGGAGNGNYMHPAFGNFMNDSTAQMGFQVGKSAVMAGQEYMEQNVCIPLQSHFRKKKGKQLIVKSKITR